MRYVQIHPSGIVIPYYAVDETHCPSVSLRRVARLSPSSPTIPEDDRRRLRLFRRLVSSRGCRRQPRRRRRVVGIVGVIARAQSPSSVASVASSLSFVAASSPSHPPLPSSSLGGRRNNKPTNQPSTGVGKAWRGIRLICSIFVLVLHPEPPC